MRKNERILPSQIAGPKIAAWARVTVAAGTATLNAGHNVAAVGLVTTGQVHVVLRPPLASGSAILITSRQTAPRFIRVNPSGNPAATGYLSVLSFDDTSSPANMNFDILVVAGGG